jgi:7,8-dihydropterin-6-yl-methyl-4-(beta-D-ribofuranosyl)aminobenzene 5'-phosphate synthase
MQPEPEFGVTSDVAITVLVDNHADLIVDSTNSVKRFHKRPLLAEHGFAALVELREAGTRILWDAGVTDVALLENAQRMDIDLRTIDLIAVSHGHGDHLAALNRVLRTMEAYPQARKWDPGTTVADVDCWLEKQGVDLVIHPAAFRERWWVFKDQSRTGPSLVPRAEWEALGARIRSSTRPYRLGPGCWTTGEIPRHSFEQAGITNEMAYRDGGSFRQDELEDDQAIVINVASKGLVILTGCAHAGVVNTVRHAKEISGVERVWAVLGGFHLGAASSEEIQLTIDALAKETPAMVAPTHCTGFQAMSAFSRQMPEAFVLGTVGTTYLF